MQRKLISALAIVAGLASIGAVAVGCKGKSDSAPAQPAPSASAPAPSASVAETPQVDASTEVSAKSGNMAHCPSSVTGANTDIKDTKDGVLITITAPADSAAGDIRARAKVLADQANHAPAEIKHTGSGEGGGAFGRCPVVMRNTLVSVSDVDHGSAITVKPKDPKEIDWLRRESRDRLSELAKPGAESAGQGKMAHCPSAVQHTKTTVKDTKDGVDVTVVAQDPKDQATEKEIRTRGQALVAAAKSDAPGVRHTGTGTGGGGFGRCPVVLKDTTVISKDVPGGATFTVKAKGAPAVGELRKEAKERAANFTQ